MVQAHIHVGCGQSCSGPTVACTLGALLGVLGPTGVLAERCAETLPVCTYLMGPCKMVCRGLRLAGFLHEGIVGPGSSTLGTEMVSSIMRCIAFIAEIAVCIQLLLLQHIVYSTIMVLNDAGHFCLRLILLVSAM